MAKKIRRIEPRFDAPDGGRGGGHDLALTDDDRIVPVGRPKKSPRPRQPAFVAAAETHRLQLQQKL